MVYIVHVRCSCKHGHNDTLDILSDTYLSFLLVEIVNNDTDEKIESEEGAKNDEHNKVNVHVEVDFPDRLFLHLKNKSFSP